MIRPFRDTPTKFGGVVRVWANGAVQVIKRDFGLTNEPECSEEAHAQMRRWLEEHMPWIFQIPVEAIVPGSTTPPPDWVPPPPPPAPIEQPPPTPPEPPPPPPEPS